MLTNLAILGATFCSDYLQYTSSPEMVDPALDKYELKLDRRTNSNVQNQPTISHRIHVLYATYANMIGVYWLDPCYHI